MKDKIVFLVKSHRGDIIGIWGNESDAKTHAEMFNGVVDEFSMDCCMNLYACGDRCTHWSYCAESEETAVESYRKYKKRR